MAAGPNHAELSPSRSLRRRGALTLLAAILLVFSPRMHAQDPAPDETTEPANPEALGAQPGLPPANQAGDPPARVARLSIMSGDVSSEPGGVDTFSPAELNQVFTSGDRLFSGPSGEAELQAGQIALRLGSGADLTVTAMTDSLAQFGLAAGSAHLRSFAIDPGTVLELDSPEAAITVLQPGDVRVDVDPAAHTTTIDLLTGQVQVDSPGSSQVLAPGQRVVIHGGDPATGQTAYAENLAPAETDALDSFSGERDNTYASGQDAASPYLNPDTIGAADLSDSGSWASSDFGPVWYPVVAIGWLPYCHGHWRWVPPWGWTWVGSERWAFAPFHYGRWADINGRWGWIPGPRVVRPIYAPALVAFSGGAQFSISLGLGPGGVTAWFPLGPHEPYAPWYHGSTLYLNRVNASNIYNPNSAEVRGFFNQRAVNVYTGVGPNGSPATRVYANRLVGTVAVPETGFAAGRPVSALRLRIPAETLAAAPLLPHPLVLPERSMVVSPGAPRALPPVASRPVMTGHSDHVTRPGETPLADSSVGGAVFMHRAQPPSQAERPSFEQERRAMQNSDPGRPLSPAQVQNLHENRPAGPPSNREAIPHPGAPPAPSRSAPPAPSHSAPAPPAATHR